MTGYQIEALLSCESVLTWVSYLIAWYRVRLQVQYHMPSTS